MAYLVGFGFVIACFWLFCIVLNMVLVVGSLRPIEALKLIAGFLFFTIMAIFGFLFVIMSLMFLLSKGTSNPLPFSMETYLMVSLIFFVPIGIANFIGDWKK